jgi:hypothetical protein
VGRASVRQIVAVYRRNDCVRQVQVIHSFCDVSRLFRIETAGLSFTDRAEAAMTRANVAAEHERRGAVGPTFENVGTTSFLTNGVQVESFDQLQHLILIRWITQTDAKPFGFGLTYLLVVADYTEFAGQLTTSREDFTGLDGNRPKEYKLSPRKETQ